MNETCLISYVKKNKLFLSPKTCPSHGKTIAPFIFEQYTKSESIYREHCDFCVGRVKTFSAKNDKPWFTEECKTLYKQYQMAIDSFNKNRSNENRLSLNLAKQRYKYLEYKLKRQYKNQQVACYQS